MSKIFHSLQVVMWITVAALSLWEKSSTMVAYFLLSTSQSHKGVTSGLQGIFARCQKTTSEQHDSCAILLSWTWQVLQQTSIILKQYCRIIFPLLNKVWARRSQISSQNVLRPCGGIWQKSYNAPSWTLIMEQAFVILYASFAQLQDLEPRHF